VKFPLYYNQAVPRGGAGTWAPSIEVDPSRLSRATLEHDMRVARIAIAGSLLIATMAMALAPAAGAATSVSYPGGCQILVSKVTALPSDELTVSASGFPVGASVTFTLTSATPPPNPVRLGTVVAVANSSGTGTATLVFKLAADTRPGRYIITASGVPAGQCNPSVSTNLEVSASTGTTAAGGTLPHTGTNSAWLLQIGLLLIALGGLVTLAARKRGAHARVDS
jgi:LPXTG-motif cell wall-anchored protein